MTTELASTPDASLRRAAADAPRTPRSTLAAVLVKGVSSLGAAVMLERGTGFLANFLAARYGGAQVYGAYSLALTTANSVAVYAGAGIGSTTTRFAGIYNRASSGYKHYLQAASIIAVSSALIAAIALGMGAGPLARLLLQNESLTSLLRFGALAAAALILVECCRGVFIGQRAYRALFVLSVSLGLGLILGLPLAARVGPVAMVLAYGCSALVAVGVCVLFGRRLALAPISAGNADSNERLSDKLRVMWSFGLVQLLGIIGLNAAGWWVTSLIARADHSLSQVGFFAVANQMRNMVAMAPALLSQVSLPLLTDESGEELGGARWIMSLATYMSTLSSVVLASAAVLALPWVLRLYGGSFQAAELTTTTAISTAVVHMASSPASARLSIVSIRMTAVINLLWAVVASVLGALWIPASGALGGAEAFFSAHLLSTILVLITLRVHGELPRGVALCSGVAMTAACLLAGSAWVRSQTPAYDTPVRAGVAAIVTILVLAFLIYGRVKGMLPRTLSFLRLRSAGA